MADWYPLLAIGIELALTLLALLWLGAPLIVRATMTQPVEPRFDVISEGTWESLPDTVRGRLETARESWPPTPGPMSPRSHPARGGLLVEAVVEAGPVSGSRLRRAGHVDRG